MLYRFEETSCRFALSFLTVASIPLERGTKRLIRRTIGGPQPFPPRVGGYNAPESVTLNPDGSLYRTRGETDGRTTGDEISGRSRRSRLPR
jgi:hypothetical protein